MLLGYLSCRRRTGCAVSSAISHVGPIHGEQNETETFLPLYIDGDAEIALSCAVSTTFIVSTRHLLSTPSLYNSTTVRAPPSLCSRSNFGTHFGSSFEGRTQEAPKTVSCGTGPQGCLPDRYIVPITSMGIITAGAASLLDQQRPVV
jgi:hypothetical protein